MTNQRAYEIMDIELQCIQKIINKNCECICDQCDLVHEDHELLEAYGLAKIALLERINREVNEKFKREAMKIITDIFPDAVTSR